MELPVEPKRCLAIAMLRAIGVNQKDTARYTRCADQAVVDAEKWLREEKDYHKVARICDNQSIKKMVAAEAVYWGLENETLVKLDRLTQDDILRHYRADYLKIVDISDPRLMKHLDEQQKKHVRKLQEMARNAFDSLPPYFPDIKTAPPEVFDDFNEAVVKVYRRLTGDPDWNELAHHLGDEAKNIESLSKELDDFLPGGSLRFPKLDRYYKTLQEAWLTIKAGGIKTISEYSDRRRWDYEDLMPTCPKCPDQNWPTSYLGVQD